MQITLISLAVVLISILVSMTLHEAMHAYASYWQGDTTAKDSGRLTLNPLAHIDLFTTILMPLLLVIFGAPPFGAAKPVPFNPYRLRWGEYGAALVGMAGPLTNLLLAIAGGTVLRFFAMDMPGAAVQILGIFTVVNLSFFLFNIIPFPPLDGSRLLYVVAPDGVRRLMERIESMGMLAILIFIIFFYYFLSDIFVKLLALLLGLVTGNVISF